ncbi:MAG: flagellar biosynthetic protein FliR [Planctomycetota bacterium]
MQWLATFSGYEQLVQGANAWWLSIVITFGWIMMRVIGFIFTMPMLTGGVPVRMRVGLAILIAFAVTPAVFGGIVVDTSLPADWIDIGISAAKELILGALIGTTVQLIFVGIQSAGELVAVTSGMGMGQTADPSTGQSTSVFARMVALLTFALLLMSGSHRLMLEATLESFRVLPPGAVPIDNSLQRLLTTSLMHGTECGLRLAAPVVACLLLSNLAVACVSRIIPHLNVFAIGMNANVLVVLILLALSVGTTGLLLEGAIAQQMELLGESFR